MFGRMFESFKIKKIIRAYNVLKKENPNLSENELCRRLIADRLYITRHTNDTGIKEIGEADYFVNKVFKDGSLNIEETCTWIMLREHEGDLLPPPGEGVSQEKIERKMKKREEFFNKAKKIKEKMS